MKKTPDEIKKGLEICSNDTMLCYEKCPYFSSISNGVDCAVEMKADALAYIQKLEAELYNTRLSFAQQTREVEEYKVALLKQVKKTIEQLPQWISVEERLPKEFATVLMMRDDIKQACVGWLIGGCWSVPNGVRVTHWMPLPEPPTEV